ncbi:NAD(P)/FAD-dependent oxidoreductase [Sandarakinorhabdus sp.]|uniref:NAD(P)/FAD-dependent oxidoreductase n=1 Tax=Sandarakinorhabdus sp. TaxID=1916663 RepID=UPI003F6FB144
MSHPLKQPLIIGGGLAGTAAAIDLARAGHAPLLLERETAPHDKICGEFLSGEAVAALVALGVDPIAHGAVPITRVQINAGPRSVTTSLPFPALSLTRRVLDDALLDRAAMVGVAVQRGTALRSLSAATVHTTAGDIKATTLLIASGKHDIRGLPRPPGPDQIGFKMYLRSARLSRALANTVAVTFFDGGYAGLQPVEGGRLNLCLLVDGAQYRSLGDWPALWARLVREPGLAALADAEQVLARPLAISRVPYGHLVPIAPDGHWRLGDQAAVIPSFCGDGMGIALTSGRLAAEMLSAGATANAYQRALFARTRRPVRLAMTALGLARHPAGRWAAMAGLGAVPGALALLARATRVADPGQKPRGLAPA